MGKTRVKTWRQSSQILHINVDRGIHQYNQSYMMGEKIRLFDFSQESQLKGLI